MSPHVEIDGRSNVMVKMLPFADRYIFDGDNVIVKDENGQVYAMVDSHGEVRVTPNLPWAEEVRVPSLDSRRRDIEVVMPGQRTVKMNPSGEVSIFDPGLRGHNILGPDGSFRNNRVSLSSDNTVLVHELPGSGSLEIRNDGRVIRWEPDCLVIFKGLEATKVLKHNCPKVERWHGKYVVRLPKNLPGFEIGDLVEVFGDRYMQHTIVVRITGLHPVTNAMQYQRWSEELVDVEKTDPRVWQLGGARPESVPDIDEQPVDDGDVASLSDFEDEELLDFSEDEEPLVDFLKKEGQL